MLVVVRGRVVIEGGVEIMRRCVVAPRGRFLGGGGVRTLDTSGGLLRLLLLLLLLLCWFASCRVVGDSEDCIKGFRSSETEYGEGIWSGCF